MAMTRAQWNALQKRLPADERTSYEEYLTSTGAIPATFAPSALAAQESGTIGAASIKSQMATAVATAEEKIAETIKTNTVIEEQGNPWDNPPYPAPEGKVWKWIGAKSVGRPGSGSWQLLDAAKPTQIKITETSPWKGSGTTGDPLTYNGSPFTGTYNGAKYVNGVLQVDNNGNKGGATSGSGTESDPLIVNGVPFSGVLGGVQYINGVAQTKAASTDTLTAKAIEDKARRTAQQDFKAALGELGLGDLADEVDRMIRLDYTVSQIKMELPKTASYQQRFPGIEALRKAGRAISEATYISNERGYLQTLRAYGLDTAILGSRTALGNYIQNEVSPREFEERVNLAATRVRENPDVMATFKTYYPEVDEGGVISYMLNPKAGLDIIKKQVRTSEIGAAATNAGFAKSLMTAAEAANLVPAVGEAAFAQIALEFKRARQLANTQSRLAQIEGQSYSDLEAIGAVVGDDVTKVLASERRAAREVARYSERGGITGASLRSITAI